MKLSNSEIVTEPIRKLLTTAEAAAYCGFKSTSAIRKAKLEGRLTPVGRRGGKGTWMWSIENLDRFLVDAPAAALGADRPGAPPIHGDVHGQQEEEQERVDETLEELGQRDPAMPEADEVRAFKWLEDERARMRSGLALVQRPSVHFGDYAVSIYEKKSAR